MSKIEIWQPRWKDRKVLIAKYKVGAINEIVFTKTKSLPGVYVISGDEVRTYPLESNGKLACYAVPIDALERRE
jgi:hypothetical protein